MSHKEFDKRIEKASKLLGSKDHKKGIADMYVLLRHDSLSDTQQSRVYFALGKSLETQNEMDEAILHYSQALREKSSDEIMVEVLFRRAQCYTKMKRFDEALADIQFVLRLSPGNERAQEMKNICQEKKELNMFGEG